MKIRIIGGPGSGKTTIAKNISEEFNIPYYDLDDFYWDNKRGYGYHKPEHQRDKELTNVLHKKEWIIEGVYYGGWCQKTIDEAEFHFYVETSLLTCYYRIIKRFLKRKTGLEKGKEETLKSFWGLLQWALKYEQKKKPEILEENPILIHNYKDARKKIKNHFNI